MYRQIPVYRIVLLLLTCTFPIGSVSAQQARPVSEEASRPLLDNEQVRVKELRLRPGGRIGPAANPNSFVYPLTDGTIVFTHPGKTPFEMSFRAGEALWLPSQVAATANETDKEIRALIGEIKQKPPVRPGAKSKAKGKAKPGAKAGAKTAAKTGPDAKSKK